MAACKWMVHLVCIAVLITSLPVALSKKPGRKRPKATIQPIAMTITTNPDYITVQESSMTSYSSSRLLINWNFTMVQDLPESTMRYLHYATNSTREEWSWDHDQIETENRTLCSDLNEDRFFVPDILAASNIQKNCPWKQGEYSVKNLPISARDLDRRGALTGFWKAVLVLTFEDIELLRLTCDVSFVKRPMILPSAEERTKGTIQPIAMTITTNPDYITVQESSVTSYNASTLLFHWNFTLLQDLPENTMMYSYYKTNGTEEGNFGWDHQEIGGNTTLCKTNRPNDNIWQNFLAASNIPNSCPWKQGVYYVKNFPIDDDIIFSFYLATGIWNAVLVLKFDETELLRLACYVSYVNPPEPS